MPNRTEKVEFPGASGSPLAARLDWPITPPLAFALFAHCFTCSKDTRASVHLAAALAERGIAVLRFDFTGLGGSAGDFSNTDFSSNVEDLVAAADFLRARYRAPEILVGHSLGGAAVLAAAGRVPEARAVATIGAPFEPAHVLRQLGDRAADIARDGAAAVDLGGRTFLIRKGFVEDVNAQSLGERLAAMRKALLVMHSPRDAVVDIDNATRIFAAAKHPKSFVSLEPADHLLTQRADALYAGHVLAAWAARYITTKAPEAPAAERGKVVVRETREGKFTQLVAAGSHVLRADEPPEVGGGDTGPSPYDLLLAGLGACTAMTVRMYADLKGLPLERITVELKHEKIHAADCADCETRAGKLDRIERVLRIEGALDDAQRARLLEISEKCPVHRTLEGEICVATTLGRPA